MQESQIVKSVASSGASALSRVVVGTIAKKIFYPEEYDADNRKRLNALKTAYRECYEDTVPDIWVLFQDNNPYQMLPEGTNWEQYVSTRIRTRKTTDLTVSVKKALKVISDFLDERRLNMGVIHDIHRGDVEELFFGEMIIWLTDTLNSNVDETLGEKIEKRRQYLDGVFDSPDIFKSQFFHDKSPSRIVIKKINHILKKSLLETQRFTLNKFQDITREIRDLHYDFLRGFSYFSEKLKDVIDLEDPELLQDFKKNGGRYTQLFLMFIEKSSSYEENDFENFDPIKEFKALMHDDTKKMDIWADMSEEIVDEISDIFAAAYSMLVVMQLIKLASITISEQGTTHLFCNKEGKDYFLFLLEDFRSELDNLMMKLTLFNEKYHAYSRAEVLDTKKNPSKENPIGQYVRFGDIFKSIKAHEENLQSFLHSATDGIEKFDGETPEKSWRKKEELYKALRERMRKKGADEMAERLEKKTQIRLLYREDVADNKDEFPESIVVSDAAMHAQGLKSSSEAATNGVSSVGRRDANNKASEETAERVNHSLMENFPNSEGALHETETYQKSIAEKTAFLRQKMKEALEKLIKYDEAFFSRLFRSPINIKLSTELRRILNYGTLDFPELDIHPIELPIFYDKLANFIDQIQDENSNNKYKLKENVSEGIYFIARDLKEIFDKKKYKYLFLDEAKNNVKLAMALQESVKLMEKQNQMLVDMRHQRKLAEDKAQALKTELDVQSEKFEEKEYHDQLAISSYKEIIGKVMIENQEHSIELSESRRHIESQEKEIDNLKKRVTKQSEDMSALKLDIQSKSKEMREQDKKISDLSNNMDDAIAKALAKYFADQERSKHQENRNSSGGNFEP
jgi:hypothetical protein